MLLWVFSGAVGSLDGASVGSLDGASVGSGGG